MLNFHNIFAESYNFLEQDSMSIFFLNRINKSKTVKKIKNNESVKIVCFGDSITWGYSFGVGVQSVLNYPFSLSFRIKNNFPKSKVNIINKGFPGWTSRDAYNYLENIKKIKPGLVFIMFGINDVLKNINIIEYKNNLNKIIKELKELHIEVVVLTPTKINHEKNKFLDLYAKKALRIAKKNYVYYINIRHVMNLALELLGLENNYFLSADNIHLRVRKYKIIADIIYKNLFL